MKPYERPWTWPRWIDTYQRDTFYVTYDAKASWHRYGGIYETRGEAIQAARILALKGFFVEIHRRDIINTGLTWRPFESHNGVAGGGNDRRDGSTEDASVEPI